MKKVILVSVLMMLFISATPSKVEPIKSVRVYQHPNISTSVDSTGIEVRSLLELSKKL